MLFVAYLDAYCSSSWRLSQQLSCGREQMADVSPACSCLCCGWPYLRTSAKVEIYVVCVAYNARTHARASPLACSEFCQPASQSVGQAFIVKESGGKLSRWLADNKTTSDPFERDFCATLAQGAQQVTAATVAASSCVNAHFTACIALRARDATRCAICR